MCVQIAENRFDNIQAPAVTEPAFSGVDPGSHRLRVRVDFCDLGLFEEGHLSVVADVGLANASGSQRAASADGFAAFEADALAPLDHRVGGTAFEGFAVRADAGLLIGVVIEVLGLKPFRSAFTWLPLFVLGLVLPGFGEPRVT